MMGAIEAWRRDKQVDDLYHEILKSMQEEMQKPTNYRCVSAAAVFGKKFNRYLQTGLVKLYPVKDEEFGKIVKDKNDPSNPLHGLHRSKDSDLSIALSTSAIGLHASAKFWHLLIH